MSDTYTFALLLVVTAAVVLAAVLANRLTQWLRIPAPALVLAASAVALQVFPDLHTPAEQTVDRLVTVALIFILFDGGMGIGWSRFRGAARPIAMVGILGTFLTAVAGALFLHLVVGLDWYAAVLVATAIAPTDPAVVFSVLGQREVSGRSGTILEGESGANDPVGIALMASLLTAGGISGGAIGHIAAEFLLQMAVGAVVGVLGGQALLWFMRHVPLPEEGLYPLRTLACALALFGVATLAHGSGFLAVFVAGILIGDARAPYKREIEHFHSGLSSLAEIVAFVALGLTVDLGVLAHTEVWVPGVALALVVSLVIRPVVVGPLLAGSGLQRNEKRFLMFAGLKGAVPLLLGSFILSEHIDDAERLYGMVVIVVVLSVVGQGSLVPTVARLLKVPMREVEPEPWSLGVRLRDEPNGVHRLTVARGSAADGSRISDLTVLPEGVWVSFVVRRGQLVPVSAETVLEAADEALVLGDPSAGPELRAVFEGSASEE
ncbi:cation:proton antiporter [Marmoricola sp. URHB0036]|uniref:cation:proton antiporter domain-containing protein n=1 Tax=Marmoricola sp. URHB0036 TaxID=1298863 RepID=UPI00041DB7FD|nr:cation:proton antiporter [Marmoricola sp. URHB0036]